VIKLAKPPAHGLAKDGTALEGEIKRDILSALARVPGVRMTINANGVTTDARGNTITYGLGPGSADLVGIATSTISEVCGFVGEDERPCAVDRVIGRVVGIEVKRPGGHTDPKRRRLQDAWIATIKRLGGIAGYAYSVEDALALVEADGFDCAEARAWWLKTAARRAAR